jgi:HSP20 family protein
MNRRDRAEEIFNDIFDTIKDKQKDIGGVVNGYTSNTTQKPAMDLIEDTENIAVITDLPGVNKEDITIDLTEDTLEITATFNEEPDGKNFIRKERRYGQVNRIISLPSKIKLDETSAVFENGVLTMVLTKQTSSKSYEVKVD